MQIGKNLTYQPKDAGLAAPVPRKPGDPKRLHDAAQQFEALMVAQMLKSVRENQDSSSSGDSTNASVLGLADEAFAKALSESGGLGLARLVEASVHQPESGTKSSSSQQVTE